MQRVERYAPCFSCVLFSMREELSAFASTAHATCDGLGARMGPIGGLLTQAPQMGSHRAESCTFGFESPAHVWYSSLARV